MFYTDTDGETASKTEDIDAAKSDEIRGKMRNRLGLSSLSLSMNYCMYQLIWILSTCCCCFTKLCGCEAEGSWYRRELLRKKRYDLAVLKMQGELSTTSYLTMKRISHLASKTWFTRSQRASTRFFHRYSVKSAEIERAEKDKKKKEFDVDRVVSERNYDQD